jgi:hypothetical protein
MSEFVILMEEYRCLKIITSQSTESVNHCRIKPNNLKGEKNMFWRNIGLDAR